MAVSELPARSKKRVTTVLKQISRPLGRIWPSSKEAVVGLLAIVVIGFVLLTYVTPLATYASQLAPSNRYLALADGLLNPFRSPRILMNSGLPVYDLQISHQQMAVVESTIDEALQQGYMSEEQQVWGDARFYYDGQEYNVDVRLRGDLPPHWEGQKKSWRIRFGRQNLEYNGEQLREPVYFQGKRAINLVIPWDRDYVAAPFVNALMREAGLVVPDDRFVVLRINGVVQGLYYEVEHFDNHLLASQERPETPVSGQNDRAMHFEQYTKYGTPIVSDSWYDIGNISFQVEEEGENVGLAMQAIQVLIDHTLNPTPANFRRARAVLDWDKYLSFRNVTTLFNTNHVRFGSDNFKLYYDPSRGLLEPIPWDVHLTRMPKEPGTIDFWNNKGPDELQRATLMDPMLRLQRNQMLWEWVGDGGDALLAQYNDMHDEIRPLAWADVLSTPIHGYRMDVLKSDFTFNVRRIHKVLSNSNANVVYRLEAKDRASLEAVVLNFSGIKLNTIHLSDPAVFEGSYQLYRDDNENGELDAVDTLVSETTANAGNISFDLNEYVLPEVVFGGEIIDGREWTYMATEAGRTHFFLVGKVDSVGRHPLQWQQPDIRVLAENAVSGLALSSDYIVSGGKLPENTVGIVAYDISEPYDLDALALTEAEFLQRHPEFQASVERPGAVELSGAVTLSETVIVPPEVPLVVRPGTDVTMMPGVSLLAYGGLRATGTESQPIRIHGDESGMAWGAFAAVRPPEEVHLRYLDVRGGGQAQVNGILFTGGLAVHDGDLRIEDCTIAGMDSEDGLNLKNGHVLIANCLFDGNASDAVDLDFVTGEVRDSVFSNNVGDGLDMSGSHVMVLHNRFEFNGDKGVSVGEDSHPTIVDGLFRGNAIGLSTKDLSHARVAYGTFIDNTLAIEAKRKKEFFGGASGEFVNNVFANNRVLFDDDYFSQGQVSITHSLTDDPAGCPTCQDATISLASAVDGNVSLATGALGSDFEMFRGAWLDEVAIESLPAVPGAFAVPES